MHEKSIELLNKAIGDEMSAIHQYMYFHLHCDDQGYELLAGLFKRTAIDEMIHVEKLGDRVLFLGGDIEMKADSETQKITTPKEMLEKACEMEQSSAHAYNVWANECSQNADSATKKIFEELVMDEERHFSQYDDEVSNLERYGDNYLALQSIERSKSVSVRNNPPQ